MKTKKSPSVMVVSIILVVSLLLGAQGSQAQSDTISQLSKTHMCVGGAAGIAYFPTQNGIGKSYEGFIAVNRGLVGGEFTVGSTTTNTIDGDRINNIDFLTMGITLNASKGIVDFTSSLYGGFASGYMENLLDKRQKINVFYQGIFGKCNFTALSFEKKSINMCFFVQVAVEAMPKQMMLTPTTGLHCMYKCLFGINFKFIPQKKITKGPTSPFAHMR
ncbi:MAG: hypothetical protein NT085_04370 [candidate division SR1 bacterium]|nr:hypothetical protein [candidate division SR1 bacterium]